MAISIAERVRDFIFSEEKCLSVQIPVGHKQESVLDGPSLLSVTIVKVNNVSRLVLANCIFSVGNQVPSDSCVLGLPKNYALGIVQ